MKKNQLFRLLFALLLCALPALIGCGASGGAETAGETTPPAETTAPAEAAAPPAEAKAA